MCTQACRRFYTAEVPGGVRQGYYFSPCDLQLIDKIPDLIEAGVDSFKIEGRMKSAEYVGSVVSAYRYVIDHYKEDKKGAIAAGKRMLASDFARTKTSYWYGFKSLEDGVNNAASAILNPDQAGGTGIYLGKISATKAAPKELVEAITENMSDDVPPEQKHIQMALLKGGSYDPDPGDSIRLHKKDDTGRVSHKVHSVELEEDSDKKVSAPNGRGTMVELKTPKFHFKADSDFKSCLRALDLGEVFDPNINSFGNAFSDENAGSTNFYLQNLKQRNEVEFNEDGSTVRSISFGAGAGGSAPLSPDGGLEVELNQPFIYIIKDINDMPIFVGHVDNPTLS
jgi:hypothetical protein